MGYRDPTWRRGHAKTLAVGAAVFAISAIAIVALLEDAPVDHGRKAVERLSSSWASCGQLGAPPCDSASVTHLRQVRAGSRDGPVVLVSGEDTRRTASREFSPGSVPGGNHEKPQDGGTHFASLRTIPSPSFSKSGGKTRRGGPPSDDTGGPA